ncbi:hypothetical protein LguiA_000331 [Lonicera macranthoides]
MLSLTTASHQFLYSPHCLHHLKLPLIPSLVLDINPGRTQRNRLGCSSFNLLLAKKNSSLGFFGLKRKKYSVSWCCWCKGWESDGDPALEAEILEFMKSSPKPEVFPTKKELIDAGRMDLVHAIRTKGGWLSLGWDSDDDIEQDEVSEHSDVLNFGEFQRRVAKILESDSLEESKVGSSGVPSVSANSSQPASPSGRSLEMLGEEDSGIEGILNRLERDRNLSFGINLRENVHGTHASSKDDGDHRHFGSSADSEGDDQEKNSRPLSGSSNRSVYENSDGKFSCKESLSKFNGSVKPEMWRTWSIQRAGFSDAEFEAAEISFGENHTKEDSRDEILAEGLEIQQKIDHGEIKARLQHLELELASTLRLLRSEKDEFISKDTDRTGYEPFWMGDGSSSSDVQKLSDALEFHENEFMDSQGRLRSIRAKLAVLEGKMALAIIEAQKIGEEKQKRINGARTALQLLRTTTIVWPNSASEVLLTGSFDGWTTQRKMEKSRTGVFNVTMKLYPGRYEIKFIVDGEWRIDPLRPVVCNDGYENNLFIVT